VPSIFLHYKVTFFRLAEDRFFGEPTFVYLCILFRSIRVQFRADTTFVREIDEVVLRIPAYFYTQAYIVNEGQPLDMNAVLDDFNSQVVAFNKRGSGYVLEHIRRLVMSVVLYRPMAGSSYIPTPKWLIVKRCAVNIENFDDNQCFKWSILACLHEAKINKKDDQTMRHTKMK